MKSEKFWLKLIEEGFHVNSIIHKLLGQIDIVDHWN